MTDILLIWIFMGLAAFLMDGINDLTVLRCKDIDLKGINAFRNAAVEALRSVPKTIKILGSCIVGGPFALALTLLTFLLLILTILEAHAVKEK